jgi:N-acetylglutamate synthase-like GNAT family acetyltransferase
MAREWRHEDSARWDEAKAAAFGELPPELFGLGAPRIGDALGGEWWRVEDDGDVVGYGGLDDVWGEAEILVVVAPSRRGGGLGGHILDQLDREASDRHLNYVYNRVAAGHPQAARLVSWLRGHGFAETADGDYRRRVRSGSVR